MANLDTDDTNAAKEKRQTKTKSSWHMFVPADAAPVANERTDEQGRRFVPTDDETLADALSFEVLGEGGEELFVVFDDYPAEIQKAHRAFGVKQGFTNMTGTKVPAEFVEKMKARHESHMNGEWAQEAGPRVSLLVEAAVRALGEAGQEVDPLQVRQLLLGQSVQERQKFAEISEIAAALAAIKAEAAARRAAEAKAKVKVGGLAQALGLAAPTA